MTLTRALSAVMEMTEAASHRKRLKARQVVNNVEKDIKPDKEPFPTSSGCGKFRYSSTMHSFLSLLVVFVSTVAALPAPINPTPINPIMDKTYFDDCDFDQKHLPITAFYTLEFLTLLLSDVQSPQELTIHSHSLPSPISQDYDVNNTFISYQIRYCSDETQQGPAPQNHIVMALNDFSRQFTDSNEPNLIVREAKTIHIVQRHQDKPFRSQQYPGLAGFGRRRSEDKGRREAQEFPSQDQTEGHTRSC